MRRWITSRILAVMLATAAAATLWAQVRVQFQQPPPEPTLELSPAQSTMLEINPDAESLLTRAHEYAQAGQYREALLLAQHVADHFPDALTSADPQLFVPARVAVRQMIRDMPAEGLNLYRLTADGEAQALVGGRVMGSRDEAALQQVVDRYFLSSIGDEAAYMLACLRLDRGQFRSAATLLRLIQTSHPDPSVEPAAINARLAFATAQSGEESDPAGATLTMGRAGLPHDGRPTLWAQSWQIRAPLPEPELAPSTRSNTGEVSFNRPRLLRRWREAGWQPTTQAVLADADEPMLIFKSAEALVCADPHSGRTLWQTPNTETSWMSDGEGGGDGWPSSDQEIVWFGDRIGRALSVIDGVVYHIEGNRTPPNSPRMAVWINGRQVQADIGNRLVAFDTITRQIKWRATMPSRLLEEATTVARGRAPVSATRFLCPPAAVDDHLLVVAEDNGEYHLAALDPSDGRLLWRRFLCAVAPGYVPPWAAAGLIVEGRTAYIVPGCGLVLAVDADDGAIRWAAGYPRLNIEEQVVTPQMISRPWMRGLAAWQDNTLLMSGDGAPKLIVAAADSPMIQLIDADTGHYLQSIDPTRYTDDPGAFNYILGVHDEAILVGGPGALAALEMSGGGLRWRSPLEGGSTGRAVLTADAVFASAGNRIVRINPRTGKWLADAPLTDAVEAPLGHLYSDGQRLLALGMDEAVALVDAQQELERLEPRIARGEAEAYLARSALYEQMDRPDDALADLRQAHEHAEVETTRRGAADRLFELLLARAGQNPDQATPLLEEAQQLAADRRQELRVRVAMARRNAATGRRDEAVRLLRQLALIAEPLIIPAGDLESPELETDVAELAAGELRRMLARDGRAVADQLDALAAGSPVSAETAYRTALAHPGTLTSLDAARALLADGAEERFGQVELALRRIVEQSEPIAPVAAAAQRLIAHAYQQRRFAVDAAAQWSQLAERFADVTPTGASSDAASMARHQSAPLQQAVNSYVDGRQLGDPPYVLQWRTHDAQGQLFLLANGQTLDASALWRDRVLTYVPNWNRVICRDAADGDELWSKQLPPDAAPSPERGAYRRFHGGVDTHVLVVRTPTRIAAYDLVDGAALWSDTSDTAPRMTQRQLPNAARSLSPGASDIDVGRGVYVEQIRRTSQPSDQLRALDLVDGRELWRRSFARHSIDGVWIVGDYVVVAVDNRAELWVCEPRTGRLVRRLRLQPHDPGGYSAWTRYGLLYQTAGGLSFAPLDGGENWSVPAVGPTMRALGVAADRYAVVQHSGFISLIDTRLGVELWKQRQDTAVRNLFDADADDDARTLILLGRSGGNQIFAAAMELATAKPICRIESGPAASVPLPEASMLARAGEIMPLIVRDRTNNQLFSIRFYRRADGRMLDRSALPAVGDEDQLQQNSQPPIIRAGRLIVPTISGLLAFGSSGEEFQLPPLDSPASAQTEEAERTPPDQVIEYRDARIELRDGTIEMRLPNGSILRAGRITINQLEVRVNEEGRLEVLENGQPVALPDDSSQPAEDVQEPPTP